MSVIFTAVLILIIIGGVVFFKFRNRTPAGPGEPAPAARPVSKPVEDDYETILAVLLKLNILVRKDKTFSTELNTEIENIIDDLMVVIPAMMERYPSETLTYEIKKIGREHLYKTVKEYLDLSRESRDAQARVFKQTIDSLKEIANRSRDIVEKNETAEFKTMANFLSGKFS